MLIILINFYPYQLEFRYFQYNFITTMKDRFPALIIVLAIVGLFSCSSKNEPSEEADKAEIMRLHNVQRLYHFKKMPHEFVALFSNQFISINKGKISKPTQEESIDRFKRYFESVEFEKWDDISEPEIRFSDDHSMAYAVVNKEVVVNYLNENQENVHEKTVFAWVAIYRKYEKGWKIDCVVSTNQTPVVN